MSHLNLFDLYLCFHFHSSQRLAQPDDSLELSDSDGNRVGTFFERDLFFSLLAITDILVDKFLMRGLGKTGLNFALGELDIFFEEIEGDGSLVIFDSLSLMNI